MGVHDGKPSRSEEVSNLSAEEQAKFAQQVKDFLAANAPQRALKPGRSEDLSQVLAEIPADVCKAELERFRQLQAEGKALQTDGGTVNDDSYVETRYYDDLNSVDKSVHHETGTGFILREDGKVAFSLGKEGEKVFRTTSKSNPATNEWEPSPSENAQTESKVHRSESSS